MKVKSLFNTKIIRFNRTDSIETTGFTMNNDNPMPDSNIGGSPNTTGEQAPSGQNANQSPSSGQNGPGGYGQQSSPSGQNGPGNHDQQKLT